MLAVDRLIHRVAKLTNFAFESYPIVGPAIERDSAVTALRAKMSRNQVIEMNCVSVKRPIGAEHIRGPIADAR